MKHNNLAHAQARFMLARMPEEERKGLLADSRDYLNRVAASHGTTLSALVEPEGEDVVIEAIATALLAAAVLDEDAIRMEFTADE